MLAHVLRIAAADGGFKTSGVSSPKLSAYLRRSGAPPTHQEHPS
jgi:hypothetical protein